MTKYIDIDGREWPSAQLALDEFINDLPSLSENDMEALTLHTLHSETPAFNLRAMKRAIEEDSRLTELFIGYPVPQPLLAHVFVPTPDGYCKCGRSFSTAEQLRDHIIRENTADLADPMEGIPT